MMTSTAHPPGMHLLLDFTHAKNLSDAVRIDQLLRDAAQACGATVLSVHVHGFGDGAGVTGVAVLAESHITLHTWPEIGYVAADIFMCGNCSPEPAVGVFEAFFESTAQIQRMTRGLTH